MQLRVLLIALGRKAQTAIEQPIQEAQQFHLAVNFDRTVRGTLTLQKCPEMFLVERHDAAAEAARRILEETGCKQSRRRQPEILE
jgi:hypothetical protein